MLTTAIVVSFIMPSATAGTNWTGTTSTDWNTAGNWGGAMYTAGQGVTINTSTGNIATITGNPTIKPGDVTVGGATFTGRLDIRAGLLQQNVIGTSGNWFFIGSGGTGNGTVNIANTAVSGQSNLTTFGQGSGSLTVGKIWVGGRDSSTGTGVLNINTTGSILAQSTDQFGTAGADSSTAASISLGNGVGASGTVKMDSGTVTATSQIWVGNKGGTGVWNQSGGTTSTSALTIARRAGTGTVTVNGGSFSATGNTNGDINGGDASFVISRGADGTATQQGTLNVGGTGVVNSTNDFLIGFAGGATSFGAVNVNAGGTLNIGTGAEKWLIVNRYDTVQGRLTVDGGALNLQNGSDIRFSTGGGTGTSFLTLKGGGTITGNAGSVIDLNTAGGTVNNTVNLDSGTLTIGQVVRTGTATGTRVFNFNGGTIKAAGSSTNFFASGIASAANVKSGGAKINSNGFDVTIAQVLQHDAALGGTSDGGLTKEGTGALSLSGANTYTGATTVNAGTLTAGVASVANTSGAFGNNSAVTLANASSTSINLANFNTQIGSLAGGGASGGNVTLGSATLTTGADNTSTSFGGVVSGTGGLTKMGSGVQTFTGANTYSGATTVNAGTLTAGVASVANTNGAFGNNSAITLANAANTGINLAGFNTQIGSLAGGGASGGNVTLGSATLTAGADNTSTSFGGVVSGTGGLNKMGSGVQTFTGANTYSGATTVNAGTLTAGVASVANTSGAFGNNSAITLANAANTGINLAGFNTQIGSLAGGGATGGNVTLGAAILTTGANNTNTSFSGVIAGSGGLTKIGSGVQTLSGSNAYTGETSVTGGTLALGAAGSLSSTQISVSSGATYDVSAVSGYSLDSGVTLTNNGTVNGAIVALAGAMLNGSGTFNDTVTVSGSLNPGNSPGIATFNNGLALAAGSNLTWELIANTDTGAGTNFDQVHVTGGDLLLEGEVTMIDSEGMPVVVEQGTVLNLNFGGSVDFANSFWGADHEWTVIDFEGTGTSDGAFNFGSISGGTGDYLEYGAFSTENRDGDIMLTWIATAVGPEPVPEPTTALLTTLGVLGLLRRRRAA